MQLRLRNVVYIHVCCCSVSVSYIGYTILRTSLIIVKILILTFIEQKLNV